MAFMICAHRAQSELRPSTAFSRRHSGQRYTYQEEAARHNLGSNDEKEANVLPTA
jgi:hypothetical protein